MENSSVFPGGFVRIGEKCTGGFGQIGSIRLKGTKNNKWSLEFITLKEIDRKGP